MKDRLAHAKFSAELSVRHKRIVAVDRFKGYDKKIRFKCRNCEMIWKETPHCLLESDGCQRCLRGQEKKKKEKTRYQEAYAPKDARLGRRTVQVFGYEQQGLKHLLTLGYNSHEITVSSEGKVPIIEYHFKRKKRQYFPDFYIPKKNQLIEVKSVYTLLMKGSAVFYQTCEKAKACLEQGYEFELLLMTKRGKRLALPDDWYDRTHQQIFDAIKGDRANQQRQARHPNMGRNRNRASGH